MGAMGFRRYTRGVEYRDLIAQLKRASGSATLSEYGSVEELGRTWPLLKLHLPGERRVVITAGFHGEEPAGPLSVARHLPELLEHAREKGVGLTIYPCVNPSGFEGGHRYNASGEQPNNDLIRYQLAPGVVKGELAQSERFERWYVYEGGPKETRALRADLETLPTPHAALDLHQDAWVKRPCHYAYIFGPPEPFQQLVRRSAPHAKAALHMRVHEQKLTDEFALIVDHDGSVTDYFHRRGTRWTATLETSTATPMEKSTFVNLIWMKAFVDFAAGG